MSKRVQKLIYKTKTNDNNEQVSSVDIILDADKVLRQNNYPKNVEDSLTEAEKNISNLESSLTTVENLLKNPNSNTLINVYNWIMKCHDEIDVLSDQVTNLSSKKFLEDFFDITTT